MSNIFQEWLRRQVQAMAPARMDRIGSGPTATPPLFPESANGGHLQNLLMPTPDPRAPMTATPLPQPAGAATGATPLAQDTAMAPMPGIQPVRRGAGQENRSARETYLADLSAGPRAPEPQTGKQKFLRGLGTIGVALTGGFQAARDFHNAPQRQAAEEYEGRLDRSKILADLEHQDQQDEEANRLRRSEIDENAAQAAAARALETQRNRPDAPAAPHDLDPFTEWRGQNPDAPVSEWLELQDKKSSAGTDAADRAAQRTQQTQENAATVRYHTRLRNIESDWQKRHGQELSQQELAVLPVSSQARTKWATYSEQDRAAAKDELRQAKQQAQNDYEDEIGTAGGSPSHYEYPGEDRRATEQPTAAPGQFRAGQTVYDKQGKARRVKRVLADGRLELE